MGECSLAESPAGVYMYARVWWDDLDGSCAGNSTRGLALSTDNGESFGDPLNAAGSDGDLDAFPGNPGTDMQGAILYSEGGSKGTFLVGSPWGVDHL